MRQAVMTSPGVVEHRETSEPKELMANEVLVKIKKIGVCGSDIHVYHGEHPATPYPVVQGHEYSAIVERVGEKVTSVTPGMQVTGRPQLICGQCGPCRRGQYNVCQELRVQGFQAPGVAQDYFVIPEDRIVVIPEHVSLDEGAMVEPTAVAAHATKRIPSLEGKNVVVCGAGTIGNLVAQFAKFRGANKVLITDLSDFRLDIARACGIEGVVNVRKQSFEEEANKFFGKEGFQVGFEAVGVQASLDVLVTNIEKGGDIVVLGVYAHNPTVNMYHLGEHELRLIGSLMYRHEDYVEAVRAISESKISLKPMITNHFEFENYADAYRFAEQEKDGFLKIIINL